MAEAKAIEKNRAEEENLKIRLKQFDSDLKRCHNELNKFGIQIRAEDKHNQRFTTGNKISGQNQSRSNE